MAHAYELDQIVKRYILDNVDGEAYGITTESIPQKARFLKEVFEGEMSHHIKQNGRNKALRDWFAGLPSGCTVAFENWEILQLAKEWGSLPEDASEREEDKIIDNWFNLLAVKAGQIMDGFRVPK